MARILVVEDDADILELISMYLQVRARWRRVEGTSVLTASGRTRGPGVLDLMLLVRGLRICQAVRRDPATARLP
jgi:DNA-binding response OmpR family regulator